MNIAIISDIHDNIPNLKKVLDYCRKQKVEKMIHCGDLATLETLDFINKNFSGEIFFTFGNMAKPFDVPVQVEIDNGSILNIKTLRELIDLGVVLNLSDVVQKWMEARDKAQAEKDRLIKKSQSAGDSSKKDTPPAKD